MAAKEVRFGDDARQKMFSGVKIYIEKKETIDFYCCL